jgi:hypothetical protein
MSKSAILKIAYCHLSLLLLIPVARAATPSVTCNLARSEVVGEGSEIVEYDKCDVPLNVITSMAGTQEVVGKLELKISTGSVRVYFTSTPGTTGTGFLGYNPVNTADQPLHMYFTHGDQTTSGILLPGVMDSYLNSSWTIKDGVHAGSNVDLICVRRNVPAEQMNPYVRRDYLKPTCAIR